MKHVILLLVAATSLMAQSVGGVSVGGGGGGASSVGALTDVTLTSESADDILEYDGSAWVNVPNPVSTYAPVGANGGNLWIGGGGQNVTGTSAQGSLNVSVGVEALRDITSGKELTAVGHGALRTATIANGSVAVGWISLGAVTTGYRNTALGSNSMSSVTTGFANVGVGYRAGNNLSTNTRSIMIGSETNSGASGSTNEIVIGDTLTGAGSNTATWGNGNITRHIFTGGIVEADDLQVYDDTPTTGATTAVVKAGAGQSTTDLMQWQDNAGTVLARVRSDGDLESPNVLTEDADDRTTAFIGTDTAEAGTTTTNLTMTAHGLSTGQVICNETRSACSSVTVVDADNVTTSAITGQASGDAIRTYNYPNRRSSWYHETTPIDDIFLDNIPLGSIEMTWDAPPTRNFDSLIYLDLPAGAAIDKGRGLFVWNHGSSDGINVLADNGGVAAAFICGDASTPTNNSFCEAHEVRSPTSIGTYVRSTATAGGPHLMFLDQQSTAAANPTAMIDITGNAAHTGFNVKNSGGNASVIYYQALDSEGDVRFQMSGNGIELGDTGDDSASTTIDFHSGSATADYDARILATGGAGTSGTGTLTFYADTVAMTGLTLKADDLDLDDGGTKPTCDSSQRGKFWFEEGAGGVADTVEICGKDAADAYAWVAIATF